MVYDIIYTYNFEEEIFLQILAIGDIVGRPGRKILRNMLAGIRRELNVDICIANAENAATGNGLTSKVMRELYSYGIDILTLGNHTWSKKEIFDFLDNEDSIVRPSNYSDDMPGKGSTIFYRGSIKIGIINACGRTFYENSKYELSCPFISVEKEIEKIKEYTNIILVDFHAEATSEKIAMGWFLDGRVSTVFGTHTHVQTADERILPNGTGYITDIGMTGPYDSVLGIEKELIIKRFITDEPVKFVIAEGTMQINGILLNIDDNSGKCVEIKRIMYMMK